MINKEKIPNCRIWINNRSKHSDERLPFEAYKSASKEGLPFGILGTLGLFLAEQGIRLYWQHKGIDIINLPNPSITYFSPISTFLLSRLYRLGSNTQGHGGLMDSVFPKEQEYTIRFLNGVTLGGIATLEFLKTGL